MHLRNGCAGELQKRQYIHNYCQHCTLFSEKGRGTHSMSTKAISIASQSCGHCSPREEISFSDDTGLTGLG